MLILIIHDWCSSVNRYVKVKNDLTQDGHVVHLMQLPGLGLEPVLWERDLLSHYSGLVASYLKHNAVGCIIAHGSGCLVAERALRLLCDTDKIWRGTTVFVSPYYMGVRKLWVLSKSDKVFREVQYNSFALNCIGGLLVKSTEDIDDTLLSDIRCTNTKIARQLLSEIVEDRLRIIPNQGLSYIICGTSDKLVRKSDVKKMAADVKARELVWLSCGHYPMLECYSEFMCAIRRILYA